MSTSHQQFELVAPTAAPNLQHWLCGRLPGIGKEQLESLFHQGRISLNGQKASPHWPINKGDAISVFRRYVAEIAPEALPLEVLYEDESLLVINKAAGMPVHLGLGHYRGTVLNALAHHYQQTGETALLQEAVVHRLDKDTSGLLVLAKSPEAKAKLAADFRAGHIHRQYEALVWGTPSPAAGIIDLPVGRVPGHSHLLATNPEGNWGKPAQTRYQTVLSGPNCSLVHIYPLTGRTHQIRIHFQHLGHALVGDRRYPQPNAPAFERLCLHASALEFTHPLSGQPLKLQSPAHFEPF